jgi:predicted nucleotidyltransferase
MDLMGSKKQALTPGRLYCGADVPMRMIRRFACQVAERFQPDKIILFGSHAYGTPHADSDVDILVIMPCRNQLDQAFKIRLAVSAPFPMDLIVRTPHNINWRLRAGDLFHTAIVTKGKVLYEKDHARVGSQSRGRLSARRRNRAPSPAL